LEAGEQAVLRVEYDSIDPYVGFLVGTAADRISSVVNRELIRRAASEAEEAAAAAASPLPPRYDADLVAAPTRAEVRDLAPTAPTITWFYGIAVLALVVQHVAVTLGALSIFRDGRRGLVELFRLSPIRSGELLIGKYLAIGLVSGVVSAALITLLVGAFRVPVLGDPAAVILVVGLLTLAGTGLGLLIGLVSDSERQVVQATLLVLLTSVFFGGLAVNLLLFAWPIQRAAAVLPITQATRIFNDVLLRGEHGDPLRYALLGAIAIALFLASEIALRRKLAPIR
jgi:ABC-2 type transport system permease protein